MARFRHISTKLVLVLDAGTENGKKVTKRVTISNIREDASADALWELAQAMGKLLEYPVAEVRLYTVEAVEREDGNGAASENDGVQHEADADMALSGGEKALPPAARAFGDSDKNEQLSRSHNDGFLKDLRLSVCRPDNDSARMASVRAAIGSAAIQHRTPLGYTRLPPAREKSKSKTGLPLALSTPELPRVKRLS